MHVITKKKLDQFARLHPDSRSALAAWYALVSDSHFEDFEQLRNAIPQVDYVRPVFVFNIGRGYRLIAAIHFNRAKVFVRHILDHAEYDRGKWKGS